LSYWTERSNWSFRDNGSDGKSRTDRRHRTDRKYWCNWSSRRNGINRATWNARCYRDLAIGTDRTDGSTRSAFCINSRRDWTNRNPGIHWFARAFGSYRNGYYRIYWTYRIDRKYRRRFYGTHGICLKRHR
jgi:hypothetical protein